MTKHSRYEQAQRDAEQERMREIEANWTSRVAPDVLAAFRSEVVAAQSRERVRPPDMAPGTRPNPPRPGREPRPPKDAQQGRRGG